MSVFALIGKIFGAKKRDKSQPTGKTIQSLRETEEMVKKRKDFLEKKIDSELFEARKNAKTNRRMAMNALKKKKRYDKYLQKTERLQQQMEEISKAISNPVALDQDFDEDELEDELNELRDANQLPETPLNEFVQVADQLPETPLEEPSAAVAKPAHVPKKKKVEEEDPDKYCKISSLGFVNKQNCLNCGFKVYGRGNLLTE
jgi:charged multivesicular body protein 4